MGFLAHRYSAICVDQTHLLQLTCQHPRSILQKIIVSTAKPFHLSQAGHDMEKEAAGRGGGINLVGQGFEVYATLFRLQ